MQTEKMFSFPAKEMIILLFSDWCEFKYTATVKSIK